MRKDSIIEAFMELSTQTVPLGPASSYRAGYRDAVSGEVICAIEIAASIAESAVLQHSKLDMLASADGRVESSVNTITTDYSMNGRPSIAEPIDSLVARLLDSENLRLEEATAGDLGTLLRRLEDSVRLVKGAISQMTNESRTQI
jgi:hypothetical protein